MDLSSPALPRAGTRPPKVAIVHYWWLTNRGGEKLVCWLAQMYPDADIFVHVGDEVLMRQMLGPGFRGRIVQSFISRLPGARRHYQKYLPLMPLASEQLDLSAYDLVLSSEAGPAKGVVTRPDAAHVCYCHSPMRYVWDLYHDYRWRTGPLTRALFTPVAHYMRLADRASADRVDHFVANSAFVAARIRKFYRRDAQVIYSPVDVSRFSPLQPRGNHYLVLGQLVPYKRADLAVEAFNELGLPLVVVGEGPQLDTLRRLAKPNVKLLGHQPFDTVRDLLQTCRGLVFPGVEDFGLVPLEAMAAGAPVIAYGAGGVLETVRDGITGTLFEEQTVASLQDAVRRIESGALQIDPLVARRHAQSFTPERFKGQMATAIAQTMAQIAAVPMVARAAALQPDATWPPAAPRSGRRRAPTAGD